MIDAKPSGGGGDISRNAKRKLIHIFKRVSSVENLLAAWQEFHVGKRRRQDVQVFERYLMDHILQLHSDLFNGSYRHGRYEEFAISDPKPRLIHKASVRDRLLHHAIYRELYPFFDPRFIFDSYSCRNGKGTHKALTRFTAVARKVSRNNTQTCWVLKCDIRKFFASIHHQTLLGILRQRIADEEMMALMRNVIESFSLAPGKGLPLGNLTSQILVNIYMNEFDQFVKHRLKAKWYIRYADDFVFLSADRQQLESWLPALTTFLTQKLHLALHPQKVSIKTLASGCDFLGWVHFPTHRVLRAATRKRMMRRMSEHPTNETTQSYLGLLRHGNAYTLSNEVLQTYGLWSEKGT